MIAALALVALLLPAVAGAGEITVLCPRVVRHVVAAAAESFQNRTRHGVWLSYLESGVIAGRALTDEADVVIASARSVAELEAKAAIRREPRVALGRVRIGVAVRAGTAAPDVASTASLRRAILQAPTLGYADPARGAPGARDVSRVLETLGVAPLVGFKTTLFADGARVLAALARGEVALAVAAITEIVGTEGVALAGPLPADIQQPVGYAAAVMARSAAPDVAAAFLAHLASAEVRAQLEAAGVEPAD